MIAAVGRWRFVSMHWKLQTTERCFPPQETVPTIAIRSRQVVAKSDGCNAGRLAATDANQPLTELVGSGTFRFVADEFSANSFATLARFQAYLPRNERPNGASGGRVARIDRVEWRVIPEPATQANALLTGEVDWINPTLDMIPLLAAQLQHHRRKLGPLRGLPMIRPNHAAGPTANIGVRRAIMAALDGREIIMAALGDEPGLVTAPIGIFAPAYYVRK